MRLSPAGKQVRAIMLEFADQTGLSTGPGIPPRRYLWTDAFAVCNFLWLYRETHDEGYKRLALRLVNQVHNVLGQHREDDRRSGWISGLDEEEGKAHPTIGGLRIGKRLNERKPGDLFDARLEWDRDGQYYHYLTKWMHALDLITRTTNDPIYNRWAMELAETAHERFTYEPFPRGQKRMYWKMSIDLSRPLVPSMGHHDPLDGFITYSQIQSTASEHHGEAGWPDLDAQIVDLAAICEGKDWTTDDPLGIGGLLGDAYRAAQMIAKGSLEHREIPEILLDASLAGLASFTEQDSLNTSSGSRLAFRELGLSIGLQAFERLQRLVERNRTLSNTSRTVPDKLRAVAPYAPLKDKIQAFWTEPENRETAGWRAHRDINMVMLATSLAPDGYLTL